MKLGRYPVIVRGSTGTVAVNCGVGSGGGTRLPRLQAKFATELKPIPLVDLGALGGWKDPQTIVKCYQKPDEITQRTALANRGTVRAEGLVSAQRTPQTDTTAPLQPEKKNPASR